MRSQSLSEKHWLGSLTCRLDTWYFGTGILVEVLMEQDVIGLVVQSA